MQEKFLQALKVLGEAQRAFGTTAELYAIQLMKSITHERESAIVLERIAPARPLRVEHHGNYYTIDWIDSCSGIVTLHTKEDLDLNLNGDLRENEISLVITHLEFLRDLVRKGKIKVFNNRHHFFMLI